MRRVAVGENRVFNFFLKKLLIYLIAQEIFIEIMILAIRLRLDPHVELYVLAYDPILYIDSNTHRHM